MNRILHPIKTFRHWRYQRNTVRNSNIKVYASRNTKFPLERCTADDLATAAAFNLRTAEQLKKSANRGKQNKQAAIHWHEMSATALTELAEKLQDGQRVEDLPVRKRKEQVLLLSRIKTAGGS